MRVSVYAHVLIRIHMHVCVYICMLDVCMYIFITESKLKGCFQCPMKWVVDKAFTRATVRVNINPI